MSGHRPWREVRDRKVVKLEVDQTPRVQPGDKVRLIIGGKKFVGIYPDGPWEEES